MEFHKRSGVIDGRSSWCKACRWDYGKTTRHHESRKRQSLKRKYGLSYIQYTTMLVAQSGLCGICGHPETAVQYGKLRRLSIDHDHITDEVRGLLCRSCNLLLGAAGDDEEVLKSAIKYLRSHRLRLVKSS